ncbi:MAG: GDYXXLXY domain-containing protein [Alphaproteobacteria bacterium]|nr:GDYXXLXY domain-containing protein [Alphaproteobacteria bacterium]MBU1513154.1 GDYXXLXY domain-containing protein [Alphaproteobacteria bacterium]MBU2095262.1 GDYXXLXY domain-containing protein [Alphaproteobacteria bacterium]MBU2152177.1 GDYXXLXY domain-containing protein [Alphaproteobacteria bacterium]MBU2306776.1 GDYXXLXY domain-containing protein [Alphaproteobacteria bacterium]
MKLPSLPIRIVAAAVVLTLALIGVVVREGLARQEGQQVVLAITGYDPRELLTGHYVRFQFRSEFPTGTPCPPGHGGYSRRPDAWVALTPAGDHHVAAGAALSREAARKLGAIVVRGDIDCLARQAPDTTWVILNLGPERMHTDQAQAEAIEKVLLATRDGAATAKAVVSIGRDGKARLKGLIVGGKLFDLDWF